MWRICKTNLKYDEVPDDHARRVFGQCYQDADEMMRLAKTEPVHTPYMIYCASREKLLAVYESKRRPGKE